MDRNSIKKFAIESRRKLMADVEYQMNLLGITSEGISEPSSKAEGMESYTLNGVKNTIYDKNIKQRENLVQEVQSKGYKNVIEEVAYTWFNRIIAIRFMEVNDYLPTRTRVLSSEIEGKSEPDIITESFDLDLDCTDEDKEIIFQLKDENKSDELFQFLFIKQCNKLNEILPQLFEKTSDYSEILLNISFTDSEGIVRQLIDNISEEDFTNEVEIIGWMYQYYNSELKIDTFKNIRRNKVYKERLPAATQLFTPNWIVKYMVENSLGRLWIEGHSNDNLKEKWIYYSEDVKQNNGIDKKLENIKKEYSLLKPKDISLIDPCMGSGHILVYAFDILMDIYLSQGYSKAEATVSILKNNIHGLDIDNRAYQLAYFSIMMKARQYNRKIFSERITFSIYPIEESNNIDKKVVNLIMNYCPEIKEDIIYLINIFYNAKEYGSILNIKKINFEKIKRELNKFSSKKYENIKFVSYQHEIKYLKSFIDQAEVLFNKYDVVITNPPYMGQKSMNKNLKGFLKKTYPSTKADLYAVFIEKCNNMLKENGLCSMITQQSFMFISTFEKLRENFLKNTLINMVHLGSNAFDEIGGEVVQTTAFTYMAHEIEFFSSKIYNLVNFNTGIDKKEAYLNNQNIIFTIQKNKFLEIPGSPIAYWANENQINAFKTGKRLDEFCEIKSGLSTGDNKRFLRFWYEVDYQNIGLGISSCEDSKKTNLKWFPHNKGGNFRKWYGNQEYIVNWQDDGYEIQNFRDDKGKVRSRPQNRPFYFKSFITWNKVASGFITYRYFSKGFIFDSVAPSIFLEEEYQKYILGFLNSNVSNDILNLISPTLGHQVGEVSSIPIIYNNNYISIINELVTKNIILTRKDWDDYETSWNFSKHPFITYKQGNLENTFINWERIKKHDFESLKKNEVELNKIFSKIYSIKINTDLEDKYVSITLANLEKDVKSFISYAVGCMFGRYSLDEDNLIYTGGIFNINNYSKFIPDDDNIIPVLDTAYFEDDMVGKLIEFIKITFGEEKLEENIDFIAGALTNKGNTSREKIRNYFLKDFFKDHSKNYQKCPIYWEFSSGNLNGFKCLVYMHRYEPDLVARIRTDYLHKTQRKIEEAIETYDNIIETTNNKSDKSKATKNKNNLIKQLEETREYDEALAHIANKKIDIDLDDGVIINYSKFQNIEVRKEGSKTKKINLLKKI